MYERLLDKNDPPSADFIEKYLGAESYGVLLELETFLNGSYDLSREMKFPFGSGYGWGYKYSHKSSHLCYVFFESGAFTVTLQLGDGCVSKVEKTLPGLSRKAQELWQNRYPCGTQGGWVHYRVTDADDLNDIFELIKIKKSINR
jgi:hypothetical protein